MIFSRFIEKLKRPDVAWNNQPNLIQEILKLLRSKKETPKVTRNSYVFLVEQRNNPNITHPKQRATNTISNAQYIDPRTYNFAFQSEFGFINSNSGTSPDQQTIPRMQLIESDSNH